MNRRQKIIVSVTGIFLVLLLLAGLTYAYFLTRIIGNTNNKSISVNTANLSIAYDDGTGAVTASNFMPGDSISKTFNVKNTGDTRGEYSIALLNVVNELTYYKDLTWTLKKNGKILKSNIFPGSDRTIIFKETIEPSINNICTVENGCLIEYELIVNYTNANYDQSIDMNKSFGALVQIQNSINDVIEINDVNQLYALSKIMTWNEARTDSNSLIPYAQLLDEDITYTTKDDIINYFIDKNYSIENNLEIKYNKTYEDDNYFNGIGCLKYTFEGNIYGNNHTITLDYTDLTYSSYMQGFGFVNYLSNGGIYDLNLVINYALNFTSSTPTSKLNVGIGLLVGKSVDSKYENISVDLNNDFIFDLSNNESNLYTANMGVINGLTDTSGESNYKNISVNLINSNVLLDVTTSTRTDKYTNNLGIVTGAIGGSSTGKRTIFDNINIHMEKTSLNLNSNDELIASVGGVIGRVNTLATVTNSKVELNNSKIEANNNNSGNLTRFEALNVGGIIGVAGAGSDNNINLGRKGTIIENVEFIAKNSTQADVIKATENQGGPVNVGGIYGFAYNNSVTNKVLVELENANIKGERLAENDTIATLGVQVGGVAGRFEHTGQIANATVNSTNSNIIANATEKANYVGGITGFAFNPIHKDLNPLINNTFNGNNSTTIQLNLISGNNENKQFYIGGLAGHAHYILENNSVHNTIVEISGIKDATYKSYSGISNYIGDYASTINGTINFEQRTAEIINPLIENVYINTNGLDEYINIKNY